MKLFCHNFGINLLSKVFRLVSCHAFVSLLKNKNLPSWLILFLLPGVIPKFITTPSVIEKDDGFSYIVGCQYVILRRTESDLAKFAYLILNETERIKLNGTSIKLNNDTFQLPEHIFVAQGTYRCLIEEKNFNIGPIRSKLSAIPMPGMTIS